MKKIILLCAAGMSTSMLVKKMQEAAAAENFECEIAAYPTAEAKDKASDADVILLGPQVRFAKSKVEAACPGIPVEAIDMKLYGRMDGKGVLETAKKLIG
ncbi:PTS sugar transporter subunit IIB [Selenomonas sp. KH1T6]|uniref:PTS sugar transporter subunit IIB n=1 Tax=Selenomonas sp. KH1T6 TaxID=3158784 RepID=UPI0008A808F5|nr:PTS system, cellobiose-specific IIB component [Selenomonas ruminantium]